MQYQSIRRTVCSLTIFGLMSCLTPGCSNTATHGPEHPEAGNSRHGYWNDQEHWVWGEPPAGATQSTSPHAPTATATPAAARTGPAPAAAAPVAANTGRLIIPTGDMPTSVLLVEKTLPGEVMTGRPFE